MIDKKKGPTTTDGRRLALSESLQSRGMELFDLSDDQGTAGLMLLASVVILEMNGEIQEAQRALVSQPEPPRFGDEHEHHFTDGRCECGRFEQGVKDELQARKPRKPPCPLDAKRGRHTYGIAIAGVSACACGATKGKPAEGMPPLPSAGLALPPGALP